MDQKPKMKLWKKVLIISLSALILLVILITVFADKYQMGITAFNKKDYEKAYLYLNQVKPDNKNYTDAMTKSKIAKQIIDSLGLIPEKDLNVSEVKENNLSAANEFKTLKTCTSDIGKINTDGNGSVGEKTEMTELLKLLESNTCDIIEITFVQKSPPDRNYDDMPLKVTYNKSSGILQNIFTSTNVIEDYKNVSEDCLKAFLKSGKQNFNSLSHFCKDMKYEFNNKEMKNSNQ